MKKCFTESKKKKVMNPASHDLEMLESLGREKWIENGNVMGLKT